MMALARHVFGPVSTHKHEHQIYMHVYGQAHLPTSTFAEHLLAFQHLFHICMATRTYLEIQDSHIFVHSACAAAKCKNHVPK